MKLLRTILLVLIVAFFLLRIPRISARQFNVDEFQHVHVVRSVSHGLLPYHDFFEHHTPFLYFLLAPVYAASGDRIETLFILRGFMLLFVLGILYLTYVLARLLYSSSVALYAVLFLSSMTVFADKTIEIRPDVPAMFFELLTIICFINALRQKGDVRNRKFLFFLSGMLTGITVLFTQKTLFFAGGIFLSLLWIARDKRMDLSASSRMAPLVWTGVGALVFPLITCFYFLLNHALWDFIYRNFIMNLFWKSKFWPYERMTSIFMENTFFCMAGFAGLVITAFRLRDRELAARGDFVLPLVIFACFLGAFLIPRPHLHYYLSFIPLLAVSCGAFFENMMERFNWCRTGQNKRWWDPWAILLLLTGILISPLGVLAPKCFNFRCSFLNGMKMHLTLKRGNAPQLAAIRYVLNHTDSRDCVLDAWNGMGVFRDHAYYQYCLSRPIVCMLNPRELSQDLLRVLQEKKPKIVILSDLSDIAAENLPDTVVKYIKEHYEPTGFRDIYILGTSR